MNCIFMWVPISMVLFACFQDTDVKEDDHGCQVIVTRPNVAGRLPIEDSVETYRHVYFINDQQGWIGGAHDIVRTINGGKDWEKMQIPNEMKCIFDDIQFPDAKSVVILATARDGANKGKCVIFRTADGGGSWTHHVVGAELSLFWYRRILFTDQSTGLLYARNGNFGQILFTDDGGKNWTKVSDQCPLNVQFIDKKRGIATLTTVGQNPSTFVTGDTGKTWQSAASPQGKVTYDFEQETEINEERELLIEQMRFIDNSHGWIHGGRGDVYMTSDGGKTWIPATPVLDWKKKEHLSVILVSAFFLNDKFACLVGEKGLTAVTSDGGRTWQRHILKLTENEELTSAFFSDNKNGWCGSKGFIYHTKDGGSTWEKIVPKDPKSNAPDDRTRARQKEIEKSAKSTARGNGNVNGRVHKNAGEGFPDLNVTLALLEKVDKGEFNVYYIRQAKTNRDGTFRFDNIKESDEYVLQIQIPAGYTHEKIKTQGAGFGGILFDTLKVRKDNPVDAHYLLKNDKE